jgi:hypothetical protein
MLLSLLLLLCLEDARALEVSPFLASVQVFLEQHAFSSSTSLSESLPEELEEISSFYLSTDPLLRLNSLSLIWTHKSLFSALHHVSLFGV